jgi:hypothetical protein
MQKVKFTRAEWKRWQENPQQTAESWGWNWDDASPQWKGWSSEKWKSLSWEEGKELLQNSKWASWILWE